MGQPQPSDNVKLFSAITFADKNKYQQAKNIIVEQYGSIDLETKIFDFTFTNYYTAEMGKNLYKQFISFQKLIQPEELIDIKLFTNNIEAQFTINNKRIVNIDPGYLTNGNIVLATTKNFSHRIYLGKGIYGDMHMQYMHNNFVFNNWTYPDYKQPLTIEFLQKVRVIYRKTFNN